MSQRLCQFMSFGSRTRSILTALLAIGLVSLLGQSLLAAAVPQTESATPSTPSSKTLQLDEPLSTEQLKKNFDAAIKELRTALKQIKRTGVQFFQSDSAGAFEYRTQWEKDAIVAELAFGKVREASFAYFLHAKSPNQEVVKIVSQLNPELMDRGQLTIGYATTKKLLELRPGDPTLTKLMGKISILTNDFETAAEFIKSNRGDIESFSIVEKNLYGYVDELKEKFQRELKIRKVETAADDLPHAIIETKKGTIVIELFENQAPETVANFISLVETGFYDRMIFHHVIQNIMAHSGKMSMNRALPIGYTIYDEAARPDARHHFRGSVSMFLNTPEPNSGGAEFQIHLIPRPNLDGKITVFGRVISDMRVVDSLQPTFEINDEGKEEFVDGAIPDTILSVTVKRLRDHEYEPNPVKK